VGAAYIVSAWLIIQVVETLFPIYGLSDAAVRQVVNLLAIGLAPVLVLAWVFEWTPEGLKKEKDIDHARSITPQTGKKLDRAIMVVLALALGYFAFDKFVLDPARDAKIETSVAEQVRSELLVESFGDNSIAVLPFVNMSDDESNAYFSDGISEELLNMLAKTPKLRVISRSSSVTFRGKDIDIPTVAKQLDVTYVLEGSVRKQGQRVRITAQLIEARSDTHLWSETYDRQLDDIFAIQDEISAAIVTELRERIGLEAETVSAARTPTNTDAHEAYLRGRYLFAQRTEASVEAAIREFEKAVSFDPDYALAYAYLSLATRRLSFSNKIPRSEAIARAAPHAERAMALDPGLAEAHAATGYVWVTPDTVEIAVKHFRRAIELNPNYSDAYLWAGNFLGGLGHYEEYFSMQEMAVHLDPLSIPPLVNYTQGLILRNRLDEASKQLEKLASIAPGVHAGSGLPGKLRSQGGQWADGILADLDGLRYDTKSDAAKALANRFAVIGLEKEALALFEPPPPLVFTVLGRPEDEITAADAHFNVEPNISNSFQLGLALAHAGEYSRAQPLLENAWRQAKNLLTDGFFSIDAALALIAIRQSMGDEDGVSEIRTAIQDNLRRYRAAGINGGTLLWNVDFEDGIAALLDGDREIGIALISRAAEEGYYIYPNAAYLQALYDDPDFAPIRASQEARQDHERERLLAIVCIDNPYAGFWQPASGTCERFVPGGRN
jgi:TolB-like protein/tetratricopeptide (TPR) repeat protein